MEDQDIPGATRAAYYTPNLDPGDNGKRYRCVIHAGSAIVNSAVATVTVGPHADNVPISQLGVNFIGGDAAGASGTLRSIDVVGVVPQANWNNLAGGTGADVALLDADGSPSPVTISFDGRTYFTGSGENTAEDVLFQGYLHNANATVTVTLRNLSSGPYDLYAYCVGFNDNATYEQAMGLAGIDPYPTFHVRAEHAGNYASAPGIFRPMSSVDPNARDQGNYVVFRDVAPDPAGTLTLTVVNESNNPNDVDVTPALSGLQLVNFGRPRLSVSILGSDVVVSWTSTATSWTLQSSDALGATANWSTVPGVNAPLTGAGSIAFPAAGEPNRARFFRLITTRG